ncbi:DUF3152 domain-containing protein [Streptomyces sp. NPDC004856]|uniref:DUF3152 domain-containing protein n=2 Tax=unclassified Streptomyces TaxID=2593676 RepID=UPI0033BF2188
MEETGARAQVRPEAGTGRRRRVPSEAPPAPAPPASAPPSAAGRPPAAGHTSTRPGAGQVRGGHPEAREPGGGWGTPVSRIAGPVASAAGPGTAAPGDSVVPGPRPRQERPGQERPRQEYIDAFDAPADPYARVTEWEAEPPAPPDDPTAAPSDAPDGGGEKRGKGMTFAGIAAAAVVTVLAVVVAGQVSDRGGSSRGSQAKGAEGTRPQGGTSRTDERAAPKEPKPTPTPATYGQKMAKKYPLAADLKASGAFTTVPGDDKAPGSGQKFRYRVDVEKGLGLDGSLFAQAVQKTLNDKRSWAHDNARTFERISSGKPDFVISLASPGTTADWCAKSGLDTTEDNVSCDSAATDRVMINAYRWAQGSKTYDDVLGDDAIHPYRQMLINHEVGHRLGFNHVNCTQDGSLAPVMQQQTKFLTSGGITCKPNPWAFPKG